MIVYVVAGFLGSGKTTFLLNLARNLVQKKLRIAVVENEIGQIPIDAWSLEDQDLQVSTLYGGCICCKMRHELANTVREIRDRYHPDAILVEPSGIAGPDMVVDLLQGVLGYTDQILTFVILDAQRIGGSFVMQPFIERSIQVADHVLINKCSLVGPEQLSNLHDHCRKLGKHGRECDVRKQTDVDDFLANLCSAPLYSTKKVDSAEFHELPGTAHVTCFPYPTSVTTHRSRMDSEIINLLQTVAKSVFSVYTTVQGHMKAYVLPSGTSFSITSSDGEVGIGKRTERGNPMEFSLERDRLSIQLIVYSVSSENLQAILNRELLAAFPRMQVI